MRLLEVVDTGNYVEQLATNIDDLLSMLLVKDIKVASTPKLVKHLNDAGFSVTDTSILSVLEKSPYVETASKRTIILKNNNEDDVASKGEVSADNDKEKVSKMAQKAAKKDLS